MDTEEHFDCAAARSELVARLDRNIEYHPAGRTIELRKALREEIARLTGEPHMGCSIRVHHAANGGWTISASYSIYPPDPA
jgi:hypothetical protein